MPHGITQCYLPPGRGDIPALTPAEAGTRLSDPGGMQGWVELSISSEIRRCRYDRRSDSWSAVSSISRPRDAVGVCGLGARLYAVGGCDDQQRYVAAVECYDPISNRWTTVSNRYWSKITGNISSVGALGSGHPSRTGPLARKYLPGFPYSRSLRR